MVMSSTGSRPLRFALLTCGLLMMLGGCMGKAASPIVSAPTLSCPDSARQEVKSEPIAPADAEFNDSADRWFFGVYAPWARDNARVREETRRTCLARPQVTVGQVIGEGA